MKNILLFLLVLFSANVFGQEELEEVKVKTRNYRLSISEKA